MPEAITETLYLENSTSLVNKLARIDAILLALETQSLTAAGTSNIEEYMLDDGQVKIRTIYRDAVSIAKAIELYEKLRTKILNKLNGRQMALRDSRGIPFNGYYY